MIVKRLAEHYEALKEDGRAPAYGWGKAAVNLGLLLSEDGEVERLIPLIQTAQMGNKEVTKPQEHIVPMPMIRPNQVLPNFLCDNASYIFGIEQKNGEKKFTSSKLLHQTFFADCDNVFAKAICAFFDKWDVTAAKEHPAVLEEQKLVTEGRGIVFMMYGNQFAHHEPELQEIWNRYYNQTMVFHYNDVWNDFKKIWMRYFNQAETAVKRLCLVSGRHEPIARLHDKVKGVPGAQSAGANLISMNANAFVSYNLSDGMPGAPIGAYSAFAHVTALNTLLADFEHRLDLGDTRTVYWAEKANKKAADLVAISLMPPRESEEHILQSIFDRVEQGLPVEDIPLRERFYVLGLRPNAARVSVSLFLESSFGDILKNIHRHYERLEIVRPVFDKRVYLTPRDIMDEIINPNSTQKKPNPQIMSGLMQAILSGSRYPYALYQSALMRVRAEQGSRKVSRGKAAVIKACLLQYLPENERKCITVSLNTETKNKAYVLGRLFATLETIQEAASPDLKKTIRDSYFNSACANPRIAFPQTLKLSEHHLKKLKRDKPGMAVNYKKQVQALLDILEVCDEPFPPYFPLNEQGLFILGYNQQRQTFFTKKEEKKEEE